MAKYFNDFTFICSCLGGFLFTFLGGYDNLAIIFLLFIVIDYITGVLSAIYNHELNSQIGLKGIIKKVTIILCVGVSCMIENYLSVPAIREIIITFFIANEGISILENIGKIGIEYPEKLKNVLEDLRGDKK